MPQANTVTQIADARTQIGVRIPALLWKRCRKLAIDLEVPINDFVEEGLEWRAKRAETQLQREPASGRR
jgi:hypothetical protein